MHTVLLSRLKYENQQVSSPYHSMMYCIEVKLSLCSVNIDLQCIKTYVAESSGYANGIIPIGSYLNLSLHGRNYPMHGAYLYMSIESHRESYSTFLRHPITLTRVFNFGVHIIGKFISWIIARRAGNSIYIWVWDDRKEPSVSFEFLSKLSSKMF